VDVCSGDMVLVECGRSLSPEMRELRKTLIGSQFVRVSLKRMWKILYSYARLRTCALSSSSFLFFLETILGLEESDPS